MTGPEEVGLAAVALWVLHYIARPSRDFYVIERKYFNRDHGPKGRGDLFAKHCEAFTDYQAARAAFDRWETVNLSIVDTVAQEAEHTLWAIPARARGDALRAVKSGKSHSGQVLAATPWAQIFERRKFWKEAAAAITEGLLS